MRHPALRGAAWLSAATLANGLIGAVVTVLLARRLGPVPIGTYALAIAVSDVAALLVSWGVDTYLVQSPEDAVEQFGTALSFVVLLSAAFLGITAILIPFFLWRRQPLVGAILAGLAVQRIFMLNGGCYGALLQRRFQFGWLALVQIITGVVEHAVAVAIALLGGGVWALLARDVLDSLGGLIGGRLISKQPYRLQWQPAVVQRLRRFGFAVLLSQSGELATHKLDSALLGLAWGARELAFYEEAFKLANVSARISQPALSQVALPAYARLRDDAARRAIAFQRVQAAGLPWLLPFVLTLLLLPDPLIRVLFGAQWIAAVPMVRVFAGYALLTPLVEHLRQLLLSQGAAGAVARAKLVQLAVFLPLLAALLARWSGVGTALAVDAGVLASFVIAAFAARRYVAGNQPVHRTYGPPVLASLAAAAAVLATAGHLPSLVRLGVLLVTYCAVLALGHQRRLRTAWTTRTRRRLP